MKKLVFCALIPFSLFAQDVKINGNSGAIDVLKSTNTSSALNDRVGVFGTSEPGPYYGVGVKGSGGWIGVQAYATVAGTGSRYGMNSQAANGEWGNFGLSASGSGDGATNTNYGVSASATGSGASHTNYGVSGYAGGAGTNYGIYGSASGGTTNYGVYCNGKGVYTDTWAKLSDVRAKKNIQDYTGALAKVMSVGVKKYDFDRAAFTTMNLKAKSEVGVIAQDLEKIFPDLVEDIVVPAPQEKNAGKSASQPGSEKTTVLKGVDYISLVPILLQAIKEQQAQIDVLKKKVGG